MYSIISVEPSHWWVAFFCHGTWQSPMPGFSLGSFRWHQTGCVCLGVPRRQQSRLEIVKPSFICACYPVLLFQILKYFRFEVLFWQIWGRMRLCFPQIVKDFMGNEELILWPALLFQPLGKQRYGCPVFWTLVIL